MHARGFDRRFCFPPLRPEYVTAALAVRDDEDQKPDASRDDGPPDAGADEEDFGTYVLTRWTVQNDHYLGLFKQWAKPIYFLVGKHWLKWDAQRTSYDVDNDVPEWRQQPVTNLTFAVFRTSLAKLTKNRPTLEVVPPSGDSEDRESAQLGESILTFLWRHLKSPRKVKLAIAWLLATGNVYFNVDWDPDAGEAKPQSCLVEVPDPMTPNETIDVPCACDETGEPLRREPKNLTDVALDGGNPYDLEAEPEMVPTGEITLDVDDPMSVRLNPEATSQDDAEEMMIGKLWPTRKCAEYFDIEIDLLTKGSGESPSDDSREDLENLLSSVTAGPPDPFSNGIQVLGSSQQEGIGERTLVIHYYRKPCAAEGYPQGRHWIVAGGQKVWPKPDDAEFPDGEAPLPFGFWPPRVALVDTPIPGQPQGLGLLSQVVPLNEQLNYLDGKIGEYHTTMAMGGVIWVAPEDRGIQITSEPGQVKVSKAYGQSGRHPIREKLEALPPAVYNERTVLENKLRMVAGLSQVDMQQRPEGVTAGRAFLVLQEASDAPFAPTLLELEEALCEVGRRELVIVKERYTEERTLKIRGQKGQYEFRSFVGSDLRDGLDVRVQVGSTFPWSKSAQWDTKLALLAAMPGLVTKPDGSIDKQELARYLDAGVPGLSTFESDMDADLVEIDREHAMFEAYDPASPKASNQLPQLGFWQNQPKHQQGHYDFLKKDYARFLRWSQSAKEAFMEHCRLTTEAVAALVDQLAPAPVAKNPGEGDPKAAAPEPGGAPRLQIEPHGGAPAKKLLKPGQSKTQLNAADRRAAGQ